MVSYGERSSELRSEGTMAMYPFLREIMNRSDKNIYGTFFANLSTRILLKDEKNFKNIDFIDTPGLTDGKISYNCDIIEMMKWISNYVDLVLVFLDPIGQALCLKTMEMIEYLSKTHYSKLRICLSKIDQIEDEMQYNTLNMQIYSAISSLTEQIKIEVIPFTIRENTIIKNKIGELDAYIDKASVTKALSRIEILTNDCYFILNHADALKKKNDAAILKNKKNMLGIVIISIVMIFIVYFFYEQ